MAAEQFAARVRDEMNKDPKTHLPRLVGLWEQIGARYKLRPKSVVFELCNEPNGKLDEVWNETSRYYSRVMPQKMSKLGANPKEKMALVFKWYFVQTTRLALRGELSRKVDYQIHCGPALGAFNQWAQGSSLEQWRHRHVDEIAAHLMIGAAKLLDERFYRWQNPTRSEGEKQSFRTV